MGGDQYENVIVHQKLAPPNTDFLASLLSISQVSFAVSDALCIELSCLTGSAVAALVTISHACNRSENISDFSYMPVVVLIHCFSCTINFCHAF